MADSPLLLVNINNYFFTLLNFYQKLASHISAKSFQMLYFFICYVSCRGGYYCPERYLKLYLALFILLTYGFLIPVEPKCQPFVCSMDRIGSRCISEYFSVAGLCSRQLYGMCEAVFRPAMQPAELFETVSQAFLNAIDRDASTGWGATVYLIERDRITSKQLKTRMD